VSGQSSASAIRIATPREERTLLTRLVTGATLPAMAARIAALLAAWWGRPFRFGTTVLAVRHADVAEVLARDLDFRIKPINAKHIDEVNGPFVLGMDRGTTLATERGVLYRALAGVDLAPIAVRLADDMEARIAKAGDAIDVIGGFARPIAAQTARQLFGLADPDDTTLMDVARAVFAHTFLNLGDDAVIRDRALAAAPLMRGWFEREIAARRYNGRLGADLMGRLMAQTADDDLVRRTLGGMMVGSIDTTASSVAKIVAAIGTDRRLAARIAIDAAEPERMRGWCWDVLRRWPHNPILLREAHGSTSLAGTTVARGDRVVAWTQAAMMDPTVFADPTRARPDRPPSVYLHFGGGLHPCAGRLLNAIQVPALVSALVRRGIDSVGPITWAGPFPDQMILKFRS
jgi:cytochrome P450